ncbi:unnamed protein product [Amoebophrya sp. A120]|nr:unnamed protein product [Amoebophrya sp. A120]|eukprot:GSA120T00025754001.1
MMMMNPAMAVPQQPRHEQYPESHTIYINNLDDRKNADILQKELTTICGAFGEVHDIICMKSFYRRGQAWVVYKNLDSAKEAMAALQNYPLFDKPMRLQYAKTKSDAIAKLDGSFVPRPKNTLKQDPTKRDAAKKKAEAEAAAKAAGNMQAAFAAVNANPMSFFQTAQPVMHQRPVVGGFPNETLFVVNLPPSVNQTMLRMLFGQYSGMREVRHVESRQCAFIEYVSEPHATAALRALANFDIKPGQKLEIGYMKK